MNKNKNIFAFLFFIIITSVSTVFFVKSKKTDVSRVTPKASLSSKELIQLFSENEEQTVAAYADKVIEVYGTLKEVSFLNEKTTFILNGLDSSATIICEMNEKNLPKELPKKNGKVLIKGVCKGFLKDVILLNCTIVKE